MNLNNGQRGSFISWGNLEAEPGSKVDAPMGTDCWFMLTQLSNIDTISGGRKMPDHQKMEQQGCVTSRCPQERSRRHSILQKGQTRLAMSKLDVQDEGQPLFKELESRRRGHPPLPQPGGTGPGKSIWDVAQKLFVQGSPCLIFLLYSMLFLKHEREYLAFERYLPATHKIGLLPFSISLSIVSYLPQTNFYPVLPVLTPNILISKVQWSLHLSFLFPSKVEADQII